MLDVVMSLTVRELLAMRELGLLARTSTGDLERG